MNVPRGSPGASIACVVMQTLAMPRQIPEGGANYKYTQVSEVRYGPMAFLAVAAHDQVLYIPVSHSVVFASFDQVGLNNSERKVWKVVIF
jgi:hypothetical protein